MFYIKCVYYYVYVGTPVYIYIVYYPPLYFNLIFLCLRISIYTDDDGATSRNADAEFFTPVPKRIHRQTHAYARGKKNLLF